MFISRRGGCRKRFCARTAVFPALASQNAKNPRPVVAIRYDADRGPFLLHFSAYFFASAASFSLYFLIISSCSCFGTTAYLANSIVYVPLPCVAERRSVE